MTSPRRFEQDLPALLDSLYLAGTPDYRNDIVRQTARVRQRPAWTFLTRWIPMDVATRRLPFKPLPWRAWAVVVLLLILTATVVLVTVGSRGRPAPPFGPARNGPLGYGQNDAIYARDSITGPERLLVGGDGTRNGFWGFSPDGTAMLIQRTVDGSDYLMVGDADGRNLHRIMETPVVDSYVAWAPDGRTVAVSTGDPGKRTLLLAHVDGSAPTKVDLASLNPSDDGQLQPTDLAWRPPVGAELLVRASAFDRTVDLYRVRADGTPIGALHLADPMAFGPDWDVSGPAWSPSGDRIAYNQVEKIAQDPGGHFRIHIVNADGTGDVRLPGPSDPLIHEAWPVWSPDGRSIAVEHFVFGDPGDDWLAVLPSDGSSAARDLLPRRPGGGDGGFIKDWLPDQTRVIARDGHGRMYSIDPVVGGKIEEISWSATDLPSVRRLAP